MSEHTAKEELVLYPAMKWVGTNYVQWLQCLLAVTLLKTALSFIGFALGKIVCKIVAVT